MRFREVFCLRKNSFQLKCFYKTVTIPTLNSTRAGMGNTTPALCLKKKVILFNKESVTARACIQQEKTVRGHVWWPCWPSQQFSLRWAIEADRTVRGHLFRAASQRCRTHRRVLHWLLSAATSAPRLGPQGHLISAPPPNPGRFDALLICLLQRLLWGRSAPPVLESPYRWDWCWKNPLLALFLCYWTTPLLPVSGEPKLPPPPRGKRKTPPTYLSFCWKLSDFSVIEWLFLSFINTLNRTMSALVWHTVQLTFYCNYFLGVIATVCKATNPVDYRILLIPV